METQATNLISDIKNNKCRSHSLFRNQHGSIRVEDCCNFLKEKRGECYWNVTMLLPNTPYTLWWTKEWIKIIPEIEKKITINKKYICLNPNTDDNFYKHHFVWTILRASYIYKFGYILYKYSEYFKNYSFLESIRYLLFFNSISCNRFICNYTYFSTNIEKARTIYNKGNFKRMYVPFSGQISISLNFPKNLYGIENRMNYLNEQYKYLDESKDISGVFLFQKDKEIYKLSSKDSCQKLGYLYYGNFVTRRSYEDYPTKDLEPAIFDFEQYYMYL